MSLVYFFAGINHFLNTDFYLRIMPPYIPFHLELVYLSGVVESLLALLLLFNKTRKKAAWGIILVLIAVFPVNIYMLTPDCCGMDFPLWALILRLPVQLVLIYWAYTFTKD